MHPVRRMTPTSSGIPSTSGMVRRTPPASAMASAAAILRRVPTCTVSTRRARTSRALSRLKMTQTLRSSTSTPGLSSSRPRSTEWPPGMTSPRVTACSTRSKPQNRLPRILLTSAAILRSYRRWTATRLAKNSFSITIPTRAFTSSRSKMHASRFTRRTEACCKSLLSTPGTTPCHRQAMW